MPETVWPVWPKHRGEFAGRARVCRIWRARPPGLLVALLLVVCAAALRAQTVPGAPTAVVAVAGNGQATVSFVPPADNGGSPITSYTVTSSPSGITASGAGSPIVVTGLLETRSYTFTVTATNAQGTGPASAPSAAATPGGNWAFNYGTSGASSYAQTIAHDAAGNVYVAGQFAGATLNLGTVTLTKIGAADGVLAGGDTLAMVALGVVLWGLHMGLTQGLLAALVADVAPASLRGTAFGVFNLATGAALLVASWAAGVLWDIEGPYAAFSAGGFCALAALAGLLSLRRRFY